MRLNSLDGANFGKLEKGIKAKAKEDFENSIYNQPALRGLYENGKGLSRIEKSDVFILKDAHKVDKNNQRLYSLEVLPNDTIEFKKPIYTGPIFDFVEGWVENSRASIGLNPALEKKMGNVQKGLNYLM